MRYFARELASAPLVLLLGCSMALAQSTGAAGNQSTPSKQHDAATAHTHRAARHHAKKPARQAYRPQEMKVQVITDGEMRTVVLPNPTAETQSKNSGPAPMGVEVINGQERETTYFNPNDTSAVQTAQPVVVGITSSDTHTVGGNKSPVVTGVDRGDKGIVQRQPVSVTPKAKRPPYRPTSK